MNVELGNSSVSDRSRCGTVFRKGLGQYAVRTKSGVVTCAISSKLRKRLVYPTADPTSLGHQSVVAVEDVKVLDPVAVGDEVVIEDSGDGTGMIKTVLPRRNQLSRRAPGPKPREQVIVANVDQVVIILAAAQPKPKWNALDRYLADTEAAGIPALICLTKIDLAKRDQLLKDLRVYQRIGYRTVLTSAVTGRGISELKEVLRDRVSVLVGKSGVGKTTLLNTLQPALGLRVHEVSGQTGKGRHTTSHLEMFDLDGGGSVVDTPGMREFGLWNVPASKFAELFREMRPYLGRCQFGTGCSHAHEPGCAIKQAVAAGGITERRYRSYLRIKG